MLMSEFINAVHQRPVLWDRSNRQYRNLEFVKSQWKEIQAMSEENQNVIKLKKKWKNLKDTYRKELKKCYTTGFTSWKHFEDLSFLKEDIVRNGNLKVTNDDNSTDNEETNVLDKEYLTIKEEINTLDSEDDFDRPAVEITGTKKCRKRKANKETFIKQTAEPATQESDEEITESSSSHQKKIFSEDYHYLMTLLPPMQKFSPAQKLRVRNKINDVILAEIEKKYDSYFD